ncbi:hypothetical protein PHMEG_000539 [Phytophthora megakarya]|uniref:Uncharacterized protein n=1 Tax=Phytophthora megakarya TaxID=4795 RepID=A0A225X3C3_9STRA|nr:hypothetical protein PHMEG_000539 [Phytophthora megakarya]
MSWLRSVSPDIKWVSERVKPRIQRNYRKLEELSSRPKTNKKREKGRTSHKHEQPAVLIGGKLRSRSSQRKRSLSDYFSTGYYSGVKGTTKYITRIWKNPSKIECIIVLRPKTEKDCGGTGEPVDIDSFRDHPVFPLLLKHKELFKQKLPMGLPPREHGEHVMEVDTKEAVFRRQSPAQEKVIMVWGDKLSHSSEDTAYAKKDSIIEKCKAHSAYEYLVLPMGLSNAPATFNDEIRRILSDLSEICQCYFDGIYVYTKSKSLEDHLTALHRVKFLVLGTTLAVMVYELIPKKTCKKHKLSGPNAAQAHFEGLKEKINFSKPFGVQMDASDHAIGGVFFQGEVRGDVVIERPVAFGGRKYKDAEKNYLQYL